MSHGNEDLLNRAYAAFVSRTAHVYRMEEGRLAEFREYPEDICALDAALS